MTFATCRTGTPNKDRKGRVRQCVGGMTTYDSETGYCVRLELGQDISSKVNPMVLAVVLGWFEFHGASAERAQRLSAGLDATIPGPARPA